MSSTIDRSKLASAQYARCTICNEAYFPVHALTPCGHDATPSLHTFEAPGTVYSWTRSHGADGAVLIAMTDFLDGELRITAPVTGVDSVDIGDELVVLSSDEVPFILAPASSAN
jgi:uncharacterized OB-fold protein